MRSAASLATLVTVLGIACCPSVHAQTTTSNALKTPPAAPVKPVVDDYHGTKVSDPYRYMENLDDPAVQSWFKAQNDYARAVLAGIPGRGRLLQRIEALDESVPQVGVRRLPGNIYDIFKRLPGDNVFKLYRRVGMTGPDTLLVDPEAVKLAPSSQNKGKNTISGGATSGDSRYEAVGIIPGGSELDGELHVFEAASGRETGDVITRVGAEGLQPCWLPDNRSFVYGRLQDLPAGAPAAEVRQKFRSYLHVLGTDPAKDAPVFGYGVVPAIDVDPSLIASVEIQFDSRYALGVLNGSVTPNSAYYIAPVSAIGKSNREWRKVADLARRGDQHRHTQR
jgi:prolyl oligopeptidase